MAHLQTPTASECALPPKGPATSSNSTSSGVQTPKPAGTVTLAPQRHAKEWASLPRLHAARSLRFPLRYSPLFVLVLGFCPPEQNVSESIYWQPLIRMAVAKAGSRSGPDEHGNTFNTQNKPETGFRQIQFAMPEVYD